MDSTYEYYKLKVPPHTFYLTISKGTTIDTISIGGKKGQCVSISVNKPGSLLVERGFHKKEIATIPILSHDPRCAVDTILPRGEGSVLIIKTILSEVKKRYNYVETFRFTDNSHITCNNGKEISLLSLYILTHSATWYAEHFKAVLEDPSLNTKYTTGIKMLSNPEIKISFNDFKSIIQQYTTTTVLRELQPIYESAPSYSEFFKKCIEDKGKYEFCNLTVDWIDSFIQFYFQFNPLTSSWIIKRDSIDTIQPETEIRLNKKPNNQSGGKYTRKNYKTSQRLVSISSILDGEFWPTK